MILVLKLNWTEYEYDQYRIEDLLLLMLEKENLLMIELISGCDIEMNEE
jgi:hypothetical protein